MGISNRPPPPPPPTHALWQIPLPEVPPPLICKSRSLEVIPPQLSRNPVHMARKA